MKMSVFIAVEIVDRVVLRINEHASCNMTYSQVTRYEICKHAVGGIMNKILDCLSEIHLYDNKIEYIIRGAIWALSWLLGIYLSWPDQISADYDFRALSCACLVFSLSFLTEFVIKLLTRPKCFISRLICGLFCLTIIGLSIISMSAIISKPICKNSHYIMYTLSKAIIGYMVIDFLVLCVLQKNTRDNYIAKSSIEEADKAKEKFIENIKDGKMGSI